MQISHISLNGTRGFNFFSLFFAHKFSARKITSRRTFVGERLFNENIHSVLDERVMEAINSYGLTNPSAAPDSLLAPGNVVTIPVRTGC